MTQGGGACVCGEGGVGRHGLQTEAGKFASHIPPDVHTGRSVSTNADHLRTQQTVDLGMHAIHLYLSRGHHRLLVDVAANGREECSHEDPVGHEQHQEHEREDGVEQQGLHAAHSSWEREHRTRLREWEHLRIGHSSHQEHRTCTRAQ